MHAYSGNLSEKNAAPPLNCNGPFTPGLSTRAHCEPVPDLDRSIPRDLSKMTSKANLCEWEDVLLWPEVYGHDCYHILLLLMLLDIYVVATNSALIVEVLFVYNI